MDAVASGCECKICHKEAQMVGTVLSSDGGRVVFYATCGKHTPQEVDATLSADGILMDCRGGNDAN